MTRKYVSIELPLFGGLDAWDRDVMRNILRAWAVQLGYTYDRGPRPGRGSITHMVQDIARGDIALVPVDHDTVALFLDALETLPDGPYRGMVENLVPPLAFAQVIKDVWDAWEAARENEDEHAIREILQKTARMALDPSRRKR